MDSIKPGSFLSVYIKNGCDQYKTLSKNDPKKKLPGVIQAASNG